MTQTITSRLETLSNVASSHLARGNKDQAEAAIVGLRHVLEAHPKVKHAKTWREIVEANEEQCAAL